MTDDREAERERDGSRNLASAKFNFIAWAFRNGKRTKLGAVDLMVLAQLVVRCDPERGAFTMSAEALAHRTGTAVSSVRRSLHRLEEIGDIEVIARPGRSSLYKVCFERAPRGWIAIQRKRYAAKREQKIDFSNPREGFAKSDKRAPKMLQGRLPNSNQPPSQHHTAVSIPSLDSEDHLLSSIRPDGRKEDAVALKDNGNSFSDRNDTFERFVDTWPRADHNIAKLRGAWYKRVIKAGYDPEDVVASALEWRRYYLENPDGVRPPFAGQWLAQQGWLEQPLPLTVEQQEWANYQEILARASKRLEEAMQKSVDDCGEDEKDWES